MMRTKADGLALQGSPPERLTYSALGTEHPAGSDAGGAAGVATAPADVVVAPRDVVEDAEAVEVETSTVLVRDGAVVVDASGLSLPQAVRPAAPRTVTAAMAARNTASPPRSG